MAVAGASSCRNQRSMYIYPPVFKFTEVTCAICLDNVKNRAFVNSCSHAFCLRCLLKWSKQKLVCPLCNQLFSVVYFCVTSSNSFQKIPLRCLIEPPDRHCSLEFGYYNSQLGRIRKLFEYGNKLTHDSKQLDINYQISIRRNPHFFRKSVYANNVWALGDPDLNKWCGPDFYLEHHDCIVQLLFPWIYRELEVVLSEKEHLIDEAFNLIVSLLQIYEIYSAKCLNILKPLLGEQTHHFLHELIHFVNSQMAMPLYDQKVLYCSVSFLRTIAKRGAIMNGPGENKDFILLDGDNASIITEGIRREEDVNSQIPTVTYADIVAITPDGHGGERLFVLNEMEVGL